MGLAGKLEDPNFIDALQRVLAGASNCGGAAAPQGPKFPVGRRLAFLRLPRGHLEERHRPMGRRAVAGWGRCGSDWGRPCHVSALQTQQPGRVEAHHLAQLVVRETQGVQAFGKQAQTLDGWRRVGLARVC